MEYFTTPFNPKGSERILFAIKVGKQTMAISEHEEYAERIVAALNLCDEVKKKTGGEVITYDKAYDELFGVTSSDASEDRKAIVKGGAGSADKAPFDGRCSPK